MPICVQRTFCHDSSVMSEIRQVTILVILNYLWPISTQQYKILKQNALCSKYDTVHVFANKLHESFDSIFFRGTCLPILLCGSFSVFLEIGIEIAVSLRKYGLCVLTQNAGANFFPFYSTEHRAFHRILFAAVVFAGQISILLGRNRSQIVQSYERSLAEIQTWVWPLNREGSCNE